MTEFRSDLALILDKGKRPNYFTPDYFDHKIHLYFISHNSKSLLFFFWKLSYPKEKNKKTGPPLIISETKWNYGATCYT